MPVLTRRRDPEARQETWHVLYGDVHVGTIGLRSGVPVHADQWQWSCDFYPLSHRGQREHSIAPDFFDARAEFSTAWSRLLPQDHRGRPRGVPARARHDRMEIPNVGLRLQNADAGDERPGAMLLR